MLPRLGQHDVVRHRKVGFNKAAEVVHNYHVQQQGILELRMGRVLLCDSLGHRVEDEVNAAGSPNLCHSGSLKKFMMTMTPLIPISVIMQNYPCNI